jgi:exosortase
MAGGFNQRKKDELSPRPQIYFLRLPLYALWVAASIAILGPAMAHVVPDILRKDEYSYILIIPLLAATIVYMERKTIFQRTFFDVPLAALFLVSALLTLCPVMLLGKNWSQTDRLAGYICALILYWTAGFALLFGRRAFRLSRFAMLFLFLTIPLPGFLSNHLIHLLEKGSAEISAVIFDLTGVPYLRDGLTFHLAKVNIEVAPQCSGIRSSMALLILALLVAHFALHSFWRQTVLVVAGICVMIVKNGIRIVTLTLLASYVDPSFLHGRLHHDGGVLFFLLGLLMLLPCLWFLQRSEKAIEKIEDTSAAPTVTNIDRGKV